ncbi:serine/threonine protein kinase, partial [Pyxidicoccus sp. 3LG]
VDKTPVQPPATRSSGKGQPPPGGLTPATESTPVAGGASKSTGSRLAERGAQGAQEDAASRKPLVRKVPVSILVRPFGIIRVDDGVPSAQPLQKHDVEVAPGRHSVTISCDYCEDVVDSIDVSENGENVFHLRAQPKPALLSFEYQPAEATVSVEGQPLSRTVQESLKVPFEVRFPRGPAGFQHSVTVNITHPGFQPARLVVHLRPGVPTKLSGSLRPE